MKTIKPTVINSSAGMLSKAFEGVLLDFRSPLSCNHAFVQLQELTKWRLGKLSLVGVVSTDSIELQMAHVLRHNGTRFQGQLLTRGEESLLVGAFKSSAYYRLSTAVFLVFLGFVMFGGLVTGLPQAFTQASNLLDVLRDIAFTFLWTAAGCLMGWLMLWNASPTHRDVVAISEAIRQALQVQ